MRTKLNKKKGFTLIELIVVIAIIALLSSITMAAVAQARKKAEISKFRSGVEEFVKALEIYKIKHGYYPMCSPYIDVCDYGDQYFNINGVWTYSNGDSNFFKDLNGPSILSILKNDKILSDNFISQKSKSLLVDVIYTDISLGTGFSGQDFGGQAYSNGFNIDGLISLFGSNTKFSGKSISDLKEYAFCISLYDENYNSIDISSPNLTKNTGDWGANGQAGLWTNINGVSPFYCSGN